MAVLNRLFKLTRGTVSVIRKDSAGVKEAQARGYVLDGEVVEEDGGYRLVNPSPSFGDEPEAPEAPEGEGENPEVTDAPTPAKALKR